MGGGGRTNHGWCREPNQPCPEQRTHTRGHGGATRELKGSENEGGRWKGSEEGSMEAKKKENPSLDDRPIHQVQSGTVPSRKWWKSVLGCCVARQMEEMQAQGDVEECIRVIESMSTECRGMPILPPPAPQHQGKKTLVIDLDETLVHSSFTPVPSPDYIIPVEINARVVDVYVRKRPWVDHFLEEVANKFEVVVFTASLTKYADPLLTRMDRCQAIHHRLFRESCVFHEGNFVKDLSRLGRRLEDVIIIDNSPHSYIFQPENAIPIGTFIDDPHDRQLIDVLPYVLALHEVQDVRKALGMAFENILLHEAEGVK